MDGLADCPFGRRIQKLIERLFANPLAGPFEIWGSLGCPFFFAGYHPTL